MPLHVACEKGAPIEIVRPLLQRHAAALYMTNDNNGDLPLHAACRAAAESLIRFLAEQDPNAVQARNNDGALPLHLLCGSSRPTLPAVNYLVDAFRGALAIRTTAGGDLPGGDLPLHAACRADADAAESLIRFLAEQDPNAVQAPNNDGALPLHLLCGSSRPTLPAVTYLVDAFREALTMRTTAGGDLPLHAACRAAAEPLMRFLAEQDPNTVQVANSDGALPLHLLCGSFRPTESAVTYLVDSFQGAAQATNNDGALPLHLLCGSSRPTLRSVKYLVDAFEGALGMVTNQGGDLPWMVACQASASESVLQVLLTSYPEALVYMQEYYSS